MGFSTTHLIIFLVIIIVIFGTKKLRNIGSDLGGAVKGKQYYGINPVLANGGPDDIGQGRLVPTMAVDQYAATLASWFGVAASDLPTVLPNIANFAGSPLGTNLGFV